MLLPPGGEAVEQAERVLRHLVERHLVLVLAALLRERAHALVHPLVAVHLRPALRLLPASAVARVSSLTSWAVTSVAVAAVVVAVIVVVVVAIVVVVAVVAVNAGGVVEGVRHRVGGAAAAVASGHEGRGDPADASREGVLVVRRGGGCRCDDSVDTGLKKEDMLACVERPWSNSCS